MISKEFKMWQRSLSDDEVKERKVTLEKQLEQDKINSFKILMFKIKCILNSIIF